MFAIEFYYKVSFSLQTVGSFNSLNMSEILKHNIDSLPMDGIKNIFFLPSFVSGFFSNIQVHKSVFFYELAATAGFSTRSPLDALCISSRPFLNDAFTRGLSSIS